MELWSPESGDVRPVASIANFIVDVTGCDLAEGRSALLGIVRASAAPAISQGLP